MTALRTTVLFVLFILLVACSQEPAEVHYGSDECAHCKMMITDGRFASQIVTDKGKSIKFDAIECMTVYHRNNKEELKNAKLWVSNFANPGEWIEAPDAQFVKSEVVKSPMGESLLAFPTATKAENHVEEQPGKLINWKEVTETKINM
ncbi:nitrous oxide reductase accessory protein NosL [Fodinibius saliphilus]|uniref:nitrous oxide reductase accessory protein NosL n=1 Tax=Fodinibius saliphilus TaxID=1920650 RepID=UPI001109266C|nr:nitrous oxide reductase accessory protein NosL [Fodinibius saliphilus]